MSSKIFLTSLLDPLLAKWPLFLALFAFLIIVKILGSARFKGWFGERAVSRGLSRLDPSTYHAFHDPYLPRPDGQGSTQLVQLDPHAFENALSILEEIHRTTDRKAAARAHLAAIHERTSAEESNSRRRGNKPPPLPTSKA